MALARTKAIGIKAVGIVEPHTDATGLVGPWAVRRSGASLPMARVVQETPLRRCTFRRLAVIAGHGSAASYSAECLYEGMDHAVAMGDLDRAWSVCEGCTRSGIFRADED